MLGGGMDTLGESLAVSQKYRCALNIKGSQ
jgi:hypothetical protein